MTMQAISGRSAYDALMSRRLIWLALALVALAGAALADILTGPAFLDVGDVLRALLDEAEAMLETFGLGALAGRDLGALSGGQRQMVFLAQALLARPRVLLLDEPTSALDLCHQLIVLEHVQDICKAHRIVAVAALHDPGQAARHAGRVVCLADGNVLAQGLPAQVLTEPLLQHLYRVTAEVASGRNGVLHITPTAAISG